MDLYESKIEKIARMCHEMNRAYCEMIHEEVKQPSWEDAPEWQKQSARDGVELHLRNPELSPAASHEAWMAAKKIQGWKYGPTKDAEAKEHPCMVPYNSLPMTQRFKDYLFACTVKAMDRMDNGA